MKQYSLLETKAGKLTFGIFLFAMLLLARDTLITSCVLGFTKSQFLMLGLIALFGLGFLIRNRAEILNILKDRRMLLVAASAVILLVPMVLKRDWQMMYFSVLICLFFAVFLSYFTNCRETAVWYLISLTVLCVHSLITMYLLKPMAVAGSIHVPVFQNSAGAEFFDFGLSFVVTDPFWRRNFGVFREPGVYQFFILLGLYLNNYEADWKHAWILWTVNIILAVTMLSTFAVGGFIEMGLLAMFVYFDKKWYRTRSGKWLGLGAVAAAAAAIAGLVWIFRGQSFGDTIFYEIYDMFLRLTTKSNSLVDRLSAIFDNLALFLRSPLVGDSVANVLHGTAHNTSSTLILFAMFGAAGGLLNVAAWIALAWKRERCLLGNLVLLLILFMSFNTQNLVADIFFWLFPYMALTERGLPLLKKKK